MTQPMKDQRERLYNAAIEYLDRGWSIIPISPAQKTPWAPWAEYQHRQPTEDEVEDWFTNGVVSKNGHVLHDFDLAVITGSTSGVVIVDADNDEAIAEAQRLGLTSECQVKTRRGKHYYWIHDGTDQHRLKVGGHVKATDFSWPKFDGLDFKGDGGYALLPPSRTSDGGTYEWLTDFDDLPNDRVWRKRNFPRDVATMTPVDIGQLSAGILPDLSGVKASTGRSLSPEEEILESGGKVLEGARNFTLTRQVGWLLKYGTLPTELMDSAYDFVSKYMGDDPLPDEEVETVVNSIIETDRRDKPWRYDNQGNFLEPEPEKVPDKKPTLQPLIFRSQAQDILESIGRENFLMFPIIPHPTIMQIYGFSGHGKSLFLGHLLYALSTGQDFVSFECMKRGRVLYLDFENGLGTIAERLQNFHDTFGQPADDSGFAVYSPSQRNTTMIDMRTDKGVTEVIRNAEAHEADVIVIDTVRTAFTGFDENKQQDWSRVNEISLQLRNLGYTIIVVHHANKPQLLAGQGTQQGMEAGSTNQLTPVEIQIRITQIFPSTDKGVQRAEEVRGVVDDNGYDIILKMKDKKEMDNFERYRLKTAIRVSYGKNRKENEAHRTTYLGFGEDKDGRAVTIGTTPIRTRVRLEALGGKYTTDEIADRYNLPQRLVKEWSGL